MEHSTERITGPADDDGEFYQPTQKFDVVVSRTAPHIAEMPGIIYMYGMGSKERGNYSAWNMKYQINSRRSSQTQLGSFRYGQGLTAL